MNKRWGASVPRAVTAISVLLLGCAVAIALFIYISSKTSLATMQNIGGDWFIEERPKSLPEPGPVPRNLYRAASGRGHVLVDTLIEQYRFYPSDCVVYQTAREAHHLFAVCGDRTPFGVASSNVAPWQFENDDLRRSSDLHLREGQLVQTVEVLSLNRIIQIAGRQRPFERDWATSVRLDFDHSLIEPVQTEMPVDVNGKSPNGSPHLLSAVLHHDWDVLDALLRAGANVNATDTNGTTALMIAASNDDLPAVERLIQAGASVNARDSMGTTALMRAADVGNKDVVQRLLAAGADPGVRDSENRTAAQRITDTEMRQLLQTSVGQPN